MKIVLSLSILINSYFIATYIIDTRNKNSLKNADFKTEFFKLKTNTKHDRKCIYFYGSKLPIENNYTEELKYFYSLSKQFKNTDFIMINVYKKSDFLPITENYNQNDGNMKLYNSVLNQYKTKMTILPMLTIIDNDSIIKNEMLFHITKKINNELFQK